MTDTNTAAADLDISNLRVVEIFGELAYKDEEDGHSLWYARIPARTEAELYAAYQRQEGAWYT